MRLLLDRQSLIWFAQGNARLSQAALEAIEKEENECFVSMAAFWEMSIKISLGKLDMAGMALKTFMRLVEEHRIFTLHISREHILEHARLAYHPDPFDRLIISQAIFEQMAVVSNDPFFGAYPIQRIW